MSKNIIHVQQAFISEVRRQIARCLRSDMNSHVIEVCLPTGWGKTRIVCQALTRHFEKWKQSYPVVLLMPRSSVLLKPWQNCVAWCRKREKTIMDCRGRTKAKVGPVPKFESKKSQLEDLELPCNLHKGKKKRPRLRITWINDTCWRKITRSTRTTKYKLLGEKGPVVIIFDEWHRKNLKKMYDKLGENEYLFDRLMTCLGLSNSSRQVVIILVSATPINPVNEIKLINALDEDPEADLEKTRKWMRQEVLRWHSTVASLNCSDMEQNDTPFIEMIERVDPFRQIWKVSIATLNRRCKNAAKELPENIIPTPRQWIKQYHAFARVFYKEKSKPPIYVVENLWLGGARYDTYFSEFGYGVATSRVMKELTALENVNGGRCLKRRVLLKFLRSSKRKYVIFCTWQATAAGLDNFLNEKGINSKYIGNRGTNTIIDDFNNLDNPRILIATDKLSEGFDLHQAEQDIIHYELSWSPLRMIQRFGRVWRILESKGKLTTPAAYHIPHSFSSEEEMLNRLKRRWEILEKETRLYYPSFEITLGQRLSSEPNISAE